MYNHSFAKMCLIGTISTVSDVAHGPLVLDKTTNKEIYFTSCQGVEFKNGACLLRKNINSI